MKVDSDQNGSAAQEQPATGALPAPSGDQDQDDDDDDDDDEEKPANPPNGAASSSIR